MFDLFGVDFGETILSPSHVRRPLLSVDCLNSVASFPKRGCKWKGLG